MSLAPTLRSPLVDRCGLCCERATRSKVALACEKHADEQFFREEREINSLRLLVRQLALALDAWADAKDDQELRDLLEKARAVAGK